MLLVLVEIHRVHHGKIRRQTTVCHFGSQKPARDDVGKYESRPWRPGMGHRLELLQLAREKHVLCPSCVATCLIEFSKRLG